MPQETLRGLGTYQLTQKEGSGALRRVPFFIGGTVLAGQSRTFKVKVPRDGTVEKLTIRIYRGPELSLRIRPYLENQRGHVRDLITYADGQPKYVAGDDDDFEFDVMEPVWARDDDYIKVDVTNTAAYDYDFAVTVEIDFAGGAWPRWAIVTEGSGG